MKRKLMTTCGLLALLIAIGVASRLIKVVCPLVPPNFHAIVGTTLFAGFVLARPALAAVVPLAAMMLSDLVLGGYEPLVMMAVYGSLLVPLCLRRWLGERPQMLRVGAASLGLSLLFFVVTNLAVWYSWYPHTLAGMVRCYTVAVPFFGYTLAGDLCFALTLFGLHALATGAWQSEKVGQTLVAERCLPVAL